MIYVNDQIILKNTHKTVTVKNFNYLLILYLKITIYKCTCFDSNLQIIKIMKMKVEILEYIKIY